MAAAGDGGANTTQPGRQVTHSVPFDAMQCDACDRLSLATLNEAPTFTEYVYLHGTTITTSATWKVLRY